MVYGDNAGIKYEKDIVDILKMKKIPMTQGPAGSGVGTDMEILYNNKKITFEMKNNVRDPDYGQCGFWPTENEDGSYSWDWNDESKRKKPDVIEFYDKFKCIDGTVGILNYIDKKKMKPNKLRSGDKDITKEQRDEDFEIEDTENRVPVEAFTLFYQEKSNYVQIGNGYGFYHINKDVANLGTEKFDAEFILRIRAKPHDTHYPLCVKCKTRYKPRTKICKKCDNELKTKTLQTCPICSKDIPYSRFEHVYFDYSFFVVMKCDKNSVKESKFNIEGKWGQEFPPIQS